VTDGGVDPDVLAAHLRRLDGAVWPALAADLWDARGYAVERDGPVLVATREGRREVLYCRPAGRESSAGPGQPVDVVVAPRDSGGQTVATEHGVRLMDARVLSEMLLYAVDRTTSRALCERHLGAAPADLEFPLATRLRRATGRLRLRPPSAPTAAVALALLVLGVVGTGLVPPTGPTGGGPPSEELFGGVGTAPIATSAEPAASEAYPPGVGPEGVADVEALASAHRRALEDASYSIWIDLYRPSRNTLRQHRVRHDVDAEVEGRRYLVTWRIDSQEVEGSVLSAYRDPSGRYVADGTGNRTTYRRGDRPAPPVPEPFVLGEVLVTRYLSTPETTVVATFTRDGRTQYRIDGSGQPASPAMDDVTDYDVVAVVDQQGFVRKLVADYTVEAGQTSYDVRLRVRYGHVGATQVDRPPWIDQFGNETASSRTAGSLVTPPSARVSR
jgi:hypothetical protein